MTDESQPDAEVVSHLGRTLSAPPEGAGEARPEALSPGDEAALAEAVRALEGSSFAAQLSGLVGRQLGFAGDLLPTRVTETANKAAATALRFALRGAIRSLPAEARPVQNRLHLAAVAASGAVGGAFGLATLPLELPLSTTLILRSVAAIARQEGEDLDDPETALSCLEVFALGTGRDVALGESSYFAVRALLAKSVTEAARHIMARGVADEATPVLSRLLGQIASRFGLVVGQKFAAQAVPVIGAVTGAAINAAFMDHYQRQARGHFVLRRLERLYGPDLVRAAYEALRTSTTADEAPVNPRTASISPSRARAALSDSPPRAP